MLPCYYDDEIDNVEQFVRNAIDMVEDYPEF
jgi:hypothetical protein